MLSINLLPPNLKHDVVAERQYRRWWVTLLILTLFATVGTGGLFFVKYELQHRADTVHQSLVTLQQQQAQDASTDITATTTKLNTTIGALRTALGKSQAWNADTATVLRALPTGVTLSALTIDPGHTFHLVGLADTRQTFLNLDSALKNPAHFSNVQTSSTASKRLSVPFDYTGVVIPETPTP